MKYASLSVRFASLVAATLAIAGCRAHHPHLVASWYAVQEPPVLPNEEARQLGSDARQGIYIAVLNRGPIVHLFTVRMNGQGSELPGFPALRSRGPVPLTTGQILVLEAGDLRRADDCSITLPVSLQVTTKAGGRPQQVRIDGTMPSALPEAWLPPCQNQSPATASERLSPPPVSQPLP